jgi:predicted nucleic acid-binding protein
LSGILIDSNVILDLVTNDARWADWSASQLAAWAAEGPLFINPLVYAEVSIGYATIERLEEVLGLLGVTELALPHEALFLAGKAFLTYRRRGGSRHSILPDFLIGAHAAVLRLPLLTRDQRLYREYYPTVGLVAPEL